MIEFKGGIHPPDFKDYTKNKGIDYGFNPSILVINLSQHIGKPAHAIVAKGDIVKKHQKIASADGSFSANIHSPVLGKIKMLANAPSPTGINVPSMIIEPIQSEPEPGQDADKKVGTAQDPESLKPLEYEKESREVLLNRIFEAGVVGMGGAAFPTHIKYKTPDPVEDLIINAAECEPFITADDALIQEKTPEIIEGIKILQRVGNAKNVHIGIEDNKPNAIAQLKKYLPAEFDLYVLPTKYPQGAEKQLIKAIVNKEVPLGTLPIKVGVIVNNIGTAFAAYNAVVKGIPLTERVVTVTGDLVKEPKNIMAPIGAKFNELLDYCSADLGDGNKKVLNGGPMMGIAQYTLDVPALKGTSAILAISDKIFDLHDEQPCIRCSRCIAACPMNLMPLIMYKLIKNKMWDDAESYGTLSCIECGSCSFVCPAKIPLVQLFKYGKQELRGRNV